MGTKRTSGNRWERRSGQESEGDEGGVGNAQTRHRDTSRHQASMIPDTSQDGPTYAMALQNDQGASLHDDRKRTTASVATGDREDRSTLVRVRWTQQNTAHLQRRPWVGNGKGRPTDQMWSDEGWCEKVREFIL